MVPKLRHAATKDVPIMHKKEEFVRDMVKKYQEGSTLRYQHNKE